MPRHLGIVLATAVLIASGACAHKRPYGAGQAPKEAALLSLAKPQVAAVQVPSAKVVLNRALRGDMAFIAQAPGRFRGGVVFAGNELVTLAFHEEGYALRYKLDAFPQGYYEGPPDGCAVQALLGISIDTDSLVSLLLGGAPLINAPFEVVDQKWSRKKGWEALVIRNDRYIEELRFDLIDSNWQYVGGELWERNGDAKGRRLWVVEHKSMDREGGAVLPGRTLVSTPGKRKDDLVTIIYKERNLAPAFAKQSGDGGDDGGEDGGDDAWGDDGDDGWDDDGGDDGWEDEGGDDGWEDGSEAAPATSGSEAPPAAGGTPPAGDAAPNGDGTADGDGTASGDGGAPADGAPSDPAPQPAPPTPASEPKPPANEPKPPASEPKSAVPDVFKLVPGTLPVQGDLCRPGG